MATLLREAAPSSGKIRNPKGRSPSTDSRLPHATDRALGAPEIIRECPTPPRSFRPILITFGSTPVIPVHPGPIQPLSAIWVHPGHSGPSWSHSGPPRSFRSILVPFGSIPVIQVHPGLLNRSGSFDLISTCSGPSGLNPGHLGSLRSKFRSFGSFRSKSRSPRIHSGLSRSFGSIPVIQVYPGSCIRVYRGHPGLSWISWFMHSGPSRSSKSILVHAFGSIPVIQVYPGSCIRVYPGHPGLSWFMHSGPSRSSRSILVHAFGSIPVTFRTILIHGHPGPFWF
ncbi:hypothetical protein CRG98_039782 [Punica granatum]|uniref:Uncharacterized protein n=1 Tax=Punica granatum TaxID=22663 RepID=A0A2I0I775_PUNGR|nr:hypothetical protein CRG98_039782 [Punica granatum]